MDFLAFSLSGFDDFLLYFGLSIVFVAVFLAIYTLVTPYSEIKLIREGNAAAAASDTAPRNTPDATLPSVIWRVRSGRNKRIATNTSSCTTSAIAAHSIMSQGLTLCVTALASGRM